MNPTETFPYGPRSPSAWIVYEPWVNAAVTLGLLVAAGVMLRASIRSTAWRGNIVLWILVMLWGLWLLSENRRLPFGDLSNFIITGTVMLIGLGGMIFSIRLSFDEGARQGFSSLAMVLAAIMVVVALILPQTSSRAVSPVTICKNNLKEIGLALHHHNHELGEIPAAVTTGDVPRSWRVELLPFLDSGPLRERYSDAETWESTANTTIAATEVHVFTCPSNSVIADSQGRRFTAYAALTGPGTVFSEDLRPTFPNVADGGGHTIAVIEACGQNIVWTAPRDVDLSATPVGINLNGKAPGRSEGLASSRHSGGPNALFVDGSVKRLSLKTDPDVLKALVTVNGGEPLDDF